MGLTPDQVLAALDETLTGWEPDDAAAHFGEIFRRNLQAKLPERPLTEAERNERRRARMATILACQSADATTELDVMRKAFILLHPLGEDAAARVMRWVKERIGDFPSAVYQAYDDEPPF